MAQVNTNKENMEIVHSGERNLSDGDSECSSEGFRGFGNESGSFEMNGDQIGLATNGVIANNEDTISGENQDNRDVNSCNNSDSLTEVLSNFMASIIQKIDQSNKNQCEQNKKLNETIHEASKKQNKTIEDVNKKLIQEFKSLLKIEIDQCKASFKDEVAKLNTKVDNNEKILSDFKNNSTKQITDIDSKIKGMNTFQGKLDEKLVLIENRVGEIEKTCAQKMKDLIGEQITVVSDKINSVSEGVLQNKKVIENLQEVNRNRELQNSHYENFNYHQDCHYDYKVSVNYCNPMQFIEGLKNYIQTNKLTNWERIKLMLSDCFKGDSKISFWWDFVREDVNNLDEFICAFKKKFWSDKIQWSFREDLRFGRFKYNEGLTFSEYYIRKFNVARYLTPRLTDEEIFMSLFEHYDDQIKTAALVRNIKNSQDFIVMLDEFGSKLYSHLSNKDIRSEHSQNYSKFEHNGGFNRFQKFDDRSQGQFEGLDRDYKKTSFQGQNRVGPYESNKRPFHRGANDYSNGRLTWKGGKEFGREGKPFERGQQAGENVKERKINLVQVNTEKENEVIEAGN